MENHPDSEGVAVSVVNEMHVQMYHNYCQITILVCFTIRLPHDHSHPPSSWQFTYKNLVVRRLQTNVFTQLHVKINMSK